MAWTYTDSPASVPRDKVRLLLGDTDANEPLCSDAEVVFALAEEGADAYRAAAYLADRLAARFGRDEQVTVDGQTIPGGQTRAAAFAALAGRLRLEGATRASVGTPVESGAGLVRNAAVVVTGLRKSDMAAADTDSDRPVPAIKREDPLAPLDQVIL